jgi:hypothetical protein
MHFLAFLGIFVPNFDIAGLSKKLIIFLTFSSCFTSLVFVFKRQLALENEVEVTLFNILTWLRGRATFCNVLNFDCKQGAHGQKKFH